MVLEMKHELKVNWFTTGDIIAQANALDSQIDSKDSVMGQVSRLIEVQLWFVDHVEWMNDKENPSDPIVGTVIITVYTWAITWSSANLSPDTYDS